MHQQLAKQCLRRQACKSQFYVFDNKNSNVGQYGDMITKECRESLIHEERVMSSVICLPGMHCSDTKQEDVP